MKNYEKQASDLLNKMGVKFTANYVKNGIHFIGDTQSRAIFRITFSRNGNKFSLMFGQSIAGGYKTPSSYSVLACIQKYNVGDIGDFCGELGYDICDKNTRKIYNAVCKEFEKVSNFFTVEEIEQLQEIN